MAGVIISIPAIERVIVPRSMKPFSNSLPRPNLLPKMRSSAARSENITIIIETKFIKTSYFHGSPTVIG